MFKKDTRVVINNRQKNEYGTIISYWMRKGTQFYNVKTERGIVLEGLTVDPQFPCFINEDLTKKINQKECKD